MTRFANHLMQEVIEGQRGQAILTQKPVSNIDECGWSWFCMMELACRACTMKGLRERSGVFMIHNIAR